jgi:hypothetical protein
MAVGVGMTLTNAPVDDVLAALVTVAERYNPPAAEMLASKAPTPGMAENLPWSCIDLKDGQHTRRSLRRRTSSRGT